MKNIIIMELAKGLETLRGITEPCAVIYLSGEDNIRALRGDGIGLKTDILETELDAEGIEFHIWQADQIIRLCERSFIRDDLYIVHDDRYNSAVNIADEVAFCYGLDFESDEVPDNEYIHDMIRIKYTQIKHSPMHIMQPMDYCKMMLEMMFEQVRMKLRGGYGMIPGGVGFFWDRQCTVMLRNGLRLDFHLETSFEDIYLPDIEDVEYVQFYYCVPEIADPSGFKGNDSGGWNCDYLDDAKFGVYDHYGHDFGYNSIDGMTIGEKPIPEKYKDYREIQRGYWEFYKNDSEKTEYCLPEMRRTYRGMVKAEEYLAGKNEYEPKYCRLPQPSIDDFICFFHPGYTGHLEQFLDMMRDNHIWDGGDLEEACVYAAYFYIGSLLHGGHCENLTLIHEFFNYYFRGYDDILSKFDKLWKIDSYVPTTDNDPVNMLCLAVYALIETARPHNGHSMPAGTYSKCLDRIYELTEGRPELNDAVIMAGAFAGTYCQTLD